MSEIKCYDIVKMIIDEATEQFASGWKAEEEKMEILKQYCDILDCLSEEFDCKAFEVEVDDIKMTISIKMFCNEMTIENKPHPFFELVKRALSVSFAYEKEDDDMSVKFVFPSIWVRRF